MIAIILFGCSAPVAPAHPQRESWPALCPGFVEESDCWRPYYPVRACARPTHPELVGLWGYTSVPEEPDQEEQFVALLLYDGCTVTINYTWQTAEDHPRTMRDVQRRSSMGPHRHVGLAHRTHALWREEMLYSTSDVTDEIPVARRVTSRDGDVRFALPNGEHRLFRFHPPLCMSPMTRDILCARDILRPGSGPGQPRFP